LAWLVLDAPIVLATVKAKNIKLFGVMEFLEVEDMKTFAQQNLNLLGEEDCKALSESRDRLQTYVDDVQTFQKHTVHSEEDWELPSEEKMDNASDEESEEEPEEDSEEDSEE